MARSVHTGRGDLESLANESVSTVRGEIDGLTRLVNSFSEVARMPDPELAPNRLHETWERAVSPFSDQMQLREEGLRQLPELRYDDDQIRRSFHNLARNALEAGAGRLDLVASQTAERIQLELVDDGPGIPAEDLPLVFEPYYTRNENGTGQGLAIVYTHNVDHGWRVHVSSADEHGGTGPRVTIDIPVRSTAEEESSNARCAPGQR